MNVEQKLILHDLELDLLHRSVKRDGQLILLTMKEMELLEYLLRNQGRIVTREMLARDVWKITTRATPLDNVIDVHINHLRKKIDGNFHIKLLHTVRGVGYSMSRQEA
jgi:DNA-binding response OmpR family regulator